MRLLAAAQSSATSISNHGNSSDWQQLLTQRKSPTSDDRGVREQNDASSARLVGSVELTDGERVAHHKARGASGRSRSKVQRAPGRIFLAFDSQKTSPKETRPRWTQAGFPSAGTVS
jgi:hypothetical protein